MANVHLTHLPDADAPRRTQLDAVLRQTLMQAREALRLVCGDFNSTPDGPVLRPLLDTGRRPSIRDAYVHGGGAEPRGTLPPGEGRAGVASPCLDLILSVAEAPDAHPMLRDARVTLDRPEPGTDIMPSDHYGVAVTVAW